MGKKCERIAVRRKSLRMAKAEFGLGVELRGERGDDVLRFGVQRDGLELARRRVAKMRERLDEAPSRIRDPRRVAGMDRGRRAAPAPPPAVPPPLREAGEAEKRARRPAAVFAEGGKEPRP